MSMDFLKISKKDLKNNCFIVKIGDKERPATDADLDDAVRQFKALFDNMNLDFEPSILLTHHAISIETIDKKGLKKITNKEIL